MLGLIRSRFVSLIVVSLLTETASENFFIRLRPDGTSKNILFKNFFQYPILYRDIFFLKNRKGEFRLHIPYNAHGTGIAILSSPFW